MNPSILDPASGAGAAIESLWWLLFGVSLAVLLVVLAGWGYALLRRRPDPDGEARPRADGKAGPEPEPEPEGRAVTWIVVAGAVVPAVILAGLTAATIRTSGHLAGNVEEALEVELVGHQFWWEVRYPDTGVVTANEVVIPAGQPVRLRLSTADVIHSLWIPRLHGKLDLTPGRTTSMTVEADEPGVYRGFCAEFCGQQHALMGLLVDARPPDAFRTWLSRQSTPAAAPTDAEAARGLALFVRHDCYLCHAVRGASFPAPPAEAGPDLTHLASRRTLAAGTVDNEQGILATWVLDPHGIKPGVRMPPTDLDEAELAALVSYLGGLR